jgi:hypothetical protein
MCNHLNLKILIHIFTIIYLIMFVIIMRGENFVAHPDGLGGTPVAHHCYSNTKINLLLLGMFCFVIRCLLFESCFLSNIRRWRRTGKGEGQKVSVTGCGVRTQWNIVIVFVRCLLSCTVQLLLLASRSKCCLETCVTFPVLKRLLKTVLFYKITSFRLPFFLPSCVPICC